MKKILLLGDSIRMSYYKRVGELLQGAADVQGPEENCRFAAHTLFQLRNYLGDTQWDVIQWNNGQWDTARVLDGKHHTPLAHYVELTARIAEILRPRTSRLIFATTTPVHEDMLEKSPFNARCNEDIRAYNAAAVAAVKPMGVETNDLYTPLAQDIKRYICEDRVHLTADGIEKCASIVAEKVSAAHCV